MSSFFLPLMLARQNMNQLRNILHEAMAMEFERPSLVRRSIRNAQSALTAPAEESHDENFKLHLDVQHFDPEKIQIKVEDNTVSIEGKHEEQQDQHGFISRHFVRKFTLPEGFDINRLESTLSSDGVLAISAPKMESKVNFRKIPITRTEQPAINNLSNNINKENSDCNVKEKINENLEGNVENK